MKVVIETGWKSRPTTHCDISLHYNGCIDITVMSNISLFPMENDMNNVLYTSLHCIAEDFGFTECEIDTRDSKTVWLWKR